MLAGLHVLKFLKNNNGQGLFFSSSSPLNLKGFSNLDWGGHVHILEDPPLGFSFFLGTSLISWKSKNKYVV